MSYYINKFFNDIGRIVGEVEPGHFGILAVVVVILGYFLLRGMNIAR